jgi:peptidoglycan hydrolase CwlO-like protein
MTKIKIEEVLRSKVMKLGYNYDSLNENDLLYLYQIEKIILEIFEREIKAKELLTNNHLSINNICGKTGIARQTIYNRPILHEYISLSKTQFSLTDISQSRALQDEKVSKLKKEVDEMRKRDCKLEELKNDIKALKIVIKDYEDEIIRLKQIINSNNDTLRKN